MNGFKFDFSKIFWGGAHRAPSPDPSPRFFSGFALGSGFALNSRALRALDSGFALDTRALRALDSGFALNFRLGILVWPPKVNSWIRLCLLTYKTLTNQQPTNLYNSLSFPSHSVSTRSSDSLVLSIPYARSSLGKRAFSVIGPRLWNSLPPDTRNSSSLPIFRSRLKTHLFKIAFPP